MTKKCMLPWTHLHTWPNNKVLACCLSPQDQPVGDLGTQTLAEVWNGQPMRDIRVAMMEEREHPNCARCYEQERAGSFSLRNDANERFKHHKDLIATTTPDGTVEHMNLVYWDFRFSNICNFKCRSCGPQLSTGWYEDHKRLGNGSLPVDIPDPKKNPDLWHQIEPLFETVEEIYFAGGEPLIMEEHYRILTRLIEMGRTDVKLRYNTNFSRMQYKNLNVLEAWQQFPYVKIGASLDGYGPVAEYIRTGTAWKDIEQNVRECYREVPHAQFGINCTTSIQNAFHVNEFFTWCVSTSFLRDANEFHINLVQDPQWLRLDALPQHIKQQVGQEFTDSAEFARVLGAHRVERCFLSAQQFMMAQDLSHVLPQFRQRMQALDTLRNERFEQMFPRLGELMCE